MKKLYTYYYFRSVRWVVVVEVAFDMYCLTNQSSLDTNRYFSLCLALSLVLSISPPVIVVAFDMYHGRTNQYFSPFLCLATYWLLLPKNYIYLLRSVRQKKTNTTTTTTTTFRWIPPWVSESLAGLLKKIRKRRRTNCWQSKIVFNKIKLLFVDLCSKKSYYYYYYCYDDDDDTDDWSRRFT